MIAPDPRRRYLMTTVKVFDLTALCVIFFVSFAISSGSFTWPDLAEVLVIRIKVANLVLFAGYVALCFAVFSACGLYRSHRLSSWKQRFSEIVLATTLVAVAFLVTQQLFDISFATRTFLPLFWVLTLGALLLSHEGMLRLLQRVRLHGRNLRNVIIIGEEPDIMVLASRLRQEAGLGYRVLRIIDANGIGEDGRVASSL
jgi:FlaA1/EpsC-like NDP-sugar epimerase